MSGSLRVLLIGASPGDVLGIQEMLRGCGREIELIHCERFEDGLALASGGAVEVGHMSDRFDGLPSAGTLWSGSLFLGAETFAGPAYLGFGLGDPGLGTPMALAILAFAMVALLSVLTLARSRR